MSVSNFSDIHQLLSQYIPPLRSHRGAYTLDRMRKLMEYLGNPQHDYKVVHVAGTSGKTSTSYYVAAMLEAAGKKVGLTISPHVDEINERVQINLKPLGEQTFTKELGLFTQKVEKSGIKPTYFELLAAFAFWQFSKAKVDYAVVEVGMGGLLDATNVITRADKVCVITDIGLDHVSVLGPDLRSIAAQKAGIIKPHNAVVCYEQPEVASVFREVCSAEHAELHEVWPVRSGELPKNLPLFQRRNWYLALATYQTVAERDGLNDLDEANLANSTSVYIPARMEAVAYKDKILVIDGAHNPQKMEAFIASLKKQYPKQKFPFLVSFVASKQEHIRACLEEILPICSNLVITTFDTANSELSSVDALKIVEQCEKLQYGHWNVEPNPQKALKLLLSKTEDIAVVTGSLYLLNHIRPVVLAIDKV